MNLENTDTIWELSCNLDDETPEAIGFAMDRLFALGALDVFTQPIGMKKNRPGVMLTVLCKPEDKEKMERGLFLYTTTLGIRACEKTRVTLDRTICTHNTPWGPIREKTVSGYGVTRSKWEYDDLAAMANHLGISLDAARGMCDRWKAENQGESKQ